MKYQPSPYNRSLLKAPRYKTVRHIRYHPYAPYLPRMQSISITQPTHSGITSSPSKKGANVHESLLQPAPPPPGGEEDCPFGYWKMILGLLIVAVVLRIVELIYGYANV
ncbi:hypothetical protein EV421DRAFT_1908640 [Armillaria borealis]|uniref:Uncharacterized protein n=1 Tax=Armillaria borealis TaxID=47425 RepID=A0AA39MHS3_9AGAR|nr:hypothetical protein EV421DRAFT_1908640 [Armillaria borealis]